ncbi:MAG: CRISPR-associated endonuclease Cas2 [Vampirovibrionales bacterium]|nr:CRISPR-associated endonuclease Cas2 [Vampirovibrionales bacterium]
MSSHTQKMLHERTYLIMYDIRDAKRLRHVHKICKQYGLPQQYSVFEARMTQRKFITFLRKVSPIIKANEDQLVCIPMCESCRKQMKVYGQSWDFTHEDSCLII